MKQLDPKAVWLFFFNFIFRWIIIAAVFSFYGSIIFPVTTMFKWLFIIISVFLIILWIWAKLTYHFYRYELREDGFRKELGVIRKKYITIPYDRIQNVDIYRGIIARILGLSDLHVQTAGMSAPVSGYGGGIAEGRLQGLSQETAEQLRDELIRRARQSKNQGL